jgi:hypothetical protein|uniref:Uncharacterized protein n=1 Tax=Globisporangium ultimum (strain ATCC 200006 / CBS 805.95 / DAOM BR144) TaxID=431595 RepID=K3WFZ7_GLOUD
MDIARLLAPEEEGAAYADADALVVGAPQPSSAAVALPVHAKKSSQTPLDDAVMTVKRPPRYRRKRRLTSKQLQTVLEKECDASALYNLTLDVNDLKQQVSELFLRKRALEIRALLTRHHFHTSVLRTTAHFFHVFRTGYRDDWDREDRAFLRAKLDANVAMGSIATGDTIFFEQWRRYKQILQQRVFRIHKTRIIVDERKACVVECTGEFEGRLTLEAIQVVFPHILRESPEMLDKVLGCRLVCPTRTLIYFDSSTRIVRYDAHADMFTGLTRILNANPMDVVTLMANARITAEGSMIPAGDDDDDIESISYDSNSGSSER